MIPTRERHMHDEDRKRREGLLPTLGALDGQKDGGLIHMNGRWAGPQYIQGSSSLSSTKFSSFRCCNCTLVDVKLSPNST